MKKVFKYATGVEIPEGAVYLCTKTEIDETQLAELKIKRNVLVWHYFLVEVRE